MNARALEQQLEALADEVGLLRRRLDPDSSAMDLADRIAGRISTIYLIVTPCASEIAAVWAPGDEEAIEEAVAIVDELWEQLQKRLGLRKERT